MLLIGLLFILLMLAGLPIGFVLGVSGMVGIFEINGTSGMINAPERFFAGLNQFTFMAMPFFIFAGEIMNRTGITAKIIDFADALVGYLRGGLAHTNMLASVMFSGMTGAAVSDAAAFGNTLVPAMVKQGYRRPFSCAVTAAGSIVGPTIPPSNLMVIYGSIMNVSIAGLFAAGIIPGLLIALACMALIAAFAKRWKLPKTGVRPSLKKIFITFKSSIIALMMPVIILGCILTGIVTPTEAASLAVLYALIVGFVIYRNITISILFSMLIRTACITGVVFLIISSANVLGWWLTYYHIPEIIANSFLSLTANPNMLLALMLGLLVLVGMFMDINAALLILAPVLFPLINVIGIDPIHAGIVIVLTLNISLMTPPVGACLFVLSSVTGERIEKISYAIIPFILVEGIVLVITAYWSDLTMFLVRYLGYAN